MRWYLGMLFACACGAAISFALLPVNEAAFAAALAVIAIVIAMVDLEFFIIPDGANVTMFAIGLFWVSTQASSGFELSALGDAVVRGVVAGGALLLLRMFYRWRTGVDGLGLGDVKLAAAGGPWLTWPSLPMVLAIAAIAALAIVAARAMAAGKAIDRTAPLPFGAFLAPSIWLVFVLDRIGFSSI